MRQRVIMFTFLLLAAVSFSPAAALMVIPVVPPIVHVQLVPEPQSQRMSCAFSVPGSASLVPTQSAVPSGALAALPKTVVVPNASCVPVNAQGAIRIPVPPPQISYTMIYPLPVSTDCIQRNAQGQFIGWLDYEHCVVSGQAMATANRFDSHFGDWHPGQAKMMLRWMTEEQWDRKAGTQFVTNVQAAVRLPNADQRLHLIISDDRDELYGQNQNDSPQYLRQQSNAAIAALRFIGLSNSTMRLDTDVGLRSGPDLFVRSRFSESIPLQNDFVFQTGAMVRYAVEDLGRASIDAGVDRAISGFGVVHLTNEMTYWQKEDHLVGARWNQGVSWTRSLSPLQSMAVGLGTEGVTRPAWARDSYGPWMLYRTAIYRNWVFYEIEPHLTRYRMYNWHTDPSVIFRLEVRFGSR